MSRATNERRRGAGATLESHGAAGAGSASVGPFGGTQGAGGATLQIPWFPALCAVALILLSLAPRIASGGAVAWSVRGAAMALLVWQAVLLLISRRGVPGAGPAWDATVVLRKQHYIQAVVQLSVYLYWGYHWRTVYDHLWLLGAQLLFAYGFDTLLSWSRGRRYVLGFGAFPIVFSTNLFLWFRDDWFYLQFLMIAAGFLGKEYVRWEREGRRVHIFNPSAFALALFSLVLIFTGTTDLTWGAEIASTLTLAPQIYLFLFGVGLIVMYHFSITLISGVAAATLFAAGALYQGATGVPYFLDSEIPAAVFLGLHLLVTDPSTSPRSQYGKVLFGFLYGAGVFALYTLLGAVGAPTFYDKLLCVPLLNLGVRWMDRVVARAGSAPRLVPGTNLVHMTVWGAFFAAMTFLGKTDGRHTGDSLPFWEEACAEGRSTACERYVQLLDTYCSDRSGWACNELGLLRMTGRPAPPDLESAIQHFAASCEMRFPQGCANLLDPERPVGGPPRAFDFRLLLREGGKNLMTMDERSLYLRACAHGWTFACTMNAGGAQ